MPCRLNRLRLWQGRLLLELEQSPAALFVTLTYSPENVPAGGNLVPRDLKLFFKRLRHHVEGPLRYFAVGEYGDRTWRPHYHAALFGLVVPSAVEASWSFGFVHCGVLNVASAGYLVRYTTKRMAQVGDPRLGGRHPEFARMSNRPGIGRRSLAPMVDVLMDRKGAAFLAANGDAPTVFNLGGKVYPLGRYLTRALREDLGRSPAQPDAKSLAFSAKKLQQDSVVRESVRAQHGNIAVARVSQRRSKGDL